MSMEQETKDFFVLIVNSIAWVLLWMMLNVLIGIYFELGFFENMPTWKNLVYYLCFLISLFLLIRHLLKKWKRI